MLLKYYNTVINSNEYFLNLALTFPKMKITSFFLIITVIKLTTVAITSKIEK